MKSASALALSLALFLAIHQGAAQIPRTISFQGVLTDSAGNPKTDGPYTIVFRLYESSTGGTAVWSEEKPVTVSKGFFSTLLGDTNPIGTNVRFDKQMWLGITVNPDPEMMPRVQLSSVGSSFYADSARVAAGVPDGVITGDKIASGQVVKSVNDLHDGIYLSAQGGATITSSNDTLIINAGSGGGGTGIQGIQNTDNTMDVVNPNGPTATINLKGNGITSRQLADQAVTMAKINRAGATTGQSPTFNGTSVVWGNPLATIGLPYTGSASSAGPAFQVTNTGTGQGMQVNSASDGIVGQTGNSTKSGVWGTNSGDGNGVRGTSAGGLGVYGQTAGSASSAVYGQNTSGVGLAPGVYGSSFSSAGVGVYGTNSGGGSSIYGYMTGTGHAGRFEINNAGNSVSALSVSTNGTGPAMDIHGNLAAQGDVAITGKLTVIGSQGPGVITFPYNTISSLVISDEAGVSFANEPGTTVYFGSASAIVSLSFTAPAAGYALVVASGALYAFHYSGYVYTVEFGLSKTAGDVSTFNTSFRYDTDMPGGNYYVPVSLSGVFPVIPGLNTFYWNGEWALGHGTNGAAIENPRLTILFLPTAYGGVASPSGAIQAATGSSKPRVTAQSTPVAERRTDVNRGSVQPAGLQSEVESLKRQLEDLRNQISQTLRK